MYIFVCTTKTINQSMENKLKTQQKKKTIHNLDFKKINLSKKQLEHIKTHYLCGDNQRYVHV